MKFPFFHIKKEFERIGNRSGFFLERDEYKGSDKTTGGFVLFRIPTLRTASFYDCISGKSTVSEEEFFFRVGIDCNPEEGIFRRFTVYAKYGTCPRGGW